MMVQLISPFEIESEDEEAFLDGWKRLVEWLRANEGFRAARLHRSASPTARGTSACRSGTIEGRSRRPWAITISSPGASRPDLLGLVGPPIPGKRLS
jgi:hypothetical protein